MSFFAGFLLGLIVWLVVFGMAQIDHEKKSVLQRFVFMRGKKFIIEDGE
jgi:hypothetical protein